MIEINYNNYFHLYVIEIGKWHFSFRLLAYSKGEIWDSSSLFSITISDDYFGIFLFFKKEIVFYSREGGWFGKKYRDGTWNQLEK